MIKGHVQDVKDAQVGGVLKARDAPELHVDIQTILEGGEYVEGVVADLLQVGLVLMDASASLNYGSGCGTSKKKTLKQMYSFQC